MKLTFPGSIDKIGKIRYVVRLEPLSVSPETEADDPYLQGSPLKQGAFIPYPWEIPSPRAAMSPFGCGMGGSK
jgi:hypothetical protein